MEKKAKAKTGRKEGGKERRWQGTENYYQELDLAVSRAGKSYSDSLILFRVLLEIIRSSLGLLARVFLLLWALVLSLLFGAGDPQQPDEEREWRRFVDEEKQ